ncbi:MAG: hypothetical protein WBM03_18400 [Steroidobacteraceae bacterium]
MKRILITAVCAAMAFPTVSAADDHGQPSRPQSYQHGGGQHHDRDGGRGHNDGHRDNDDGDHRYNTGGRYPYYVQHRPYYYYRGYPPYYYGHSYPYYYGHNHHDGNDDDALWAIGGLVVGAIIGNAVAHASTPPPATTSAPPASQPQQYCDRVEYDSAGNPYVERSCAR